MVKEAEANKEADEKRKEEAEIRNKAESFISQMDEALSKEGSSMTEDQKSQAQTLRDDIKRALDNNDMETLKAKMEQVDQMMAMAQQYAQNQQANPNPSQANSTNQANDDVVDADFTEKN